MKDLKRFSNRVPWALAVVMLFFASCADQCTQPCGVFTYNDGGLVDNPTDGNGIDMSVDFDFNPADCGVACECDKIAFVQIVRVVDEDDGSYKFASAEKEDRATSEGFYLDRLAGKIWGYYGRNDDGSFAGSITVGSDASTASLIDRPRRGDAEPWLGTTWMAITVPVCLDNPGSACNNNLLGFYEWGWLLDGAGTASGPFNFIAPKAFKDDFDDAVAEWNIQAPGLGKNNFPAFTRLSE